MCGRDEAYRCCADGIKRSSLTSLGHIKHLERAAVAAGELIAQAVVAWWKTDTSSSGVAEDWSEQQ